MFNKNYRMARPDSSITRLPADFLIDWDRSLIDVHYGSDMGDHIPFRRLERYIRATSMPLDMSNKSI